MTVTVLPTRPPRDRYPGPRPAPSHRRAPEADPTTLTLSFVVTLGGENRYLDGVEVLETLRRVTDRLAAAEVRVTPPIVAATMESTVDQSGPTVRLRPPAPEEVHPSPPEPVHILTDTREVRLGRRAIPFTRIEFDLLAFLASHPRQVFTRDQLLQRVWGFAHGGHRTVDVHIRRLRAKLADRPVATTVRGVGYRLADRANLYITRRRPVSEVDAEAWI